MGKQTDTNETDRKISTQELERAGRFDEALERLADLELDGVSDRVFDEMLEKLADVRKLVGR